MSESVASLALLLEQHAPWVGLTGAGISNASGIPTYRDHHGRWLGSQPIQHQEFVE
jgi:NAD-dependent SIR2 family protein deacetylase